MSIQINVKKLAGSNRVSTYGVELTDTIKVLKLKITDKEGGMPAEAFRLIYLGQQVEDSKTVADYSVEEGSTLYLVLR